MPSMKQYLAGEHQLLYIVSFGLSVLGNFSKVEKHDTLGQPSQAGLPVE